MRKIGIQQIEDVALGASLLGAGGGGDMSFAAAAENEGDRRD